MSENSQSASDPDDPIRVLWTVEDYLNARFVVRDAGLTEEQRRSLPVYAVRSLTQADIQRFCSGCQMLKANGFCRLGRRDQLRYVARNWCGWAEKNGRRGEMTRDGFFPAGAR